MHASDLKTEWEKHTLHKEGKHIKVVFLSGLFNYLSCDTLISKKLEHNQQLFLNKNSVSWLRNS